MRDRLLRIVYDRPITGSPHRECFRRNGCACTLLPSYRLRFMLQTARQHVHDSLEGFSLADCPAEAAFPPRTESRPVGP